MTLLSRCLPTCPRSRGGTMHPLLPLFHTDCAAVIRVLRPGGHCSVQYLARLGTIPHRRGPRIEQASPYRMHTPQRPLQSGACYTCCNCNFHLHLHPITKSRGDRHGTNGLRDCTATLRSLIQFRGGKTFLRPAVTGPAGAFTVAATIGIKSRRPSGTLCPRPPARVER